VHIISFSANYPATCSASRRHCLRLRDNGHINDEVLRQLEHELDLTRLACLTVDGTKCLCGFPSSAETTAARLAN